MRYLALTLIASTLLAACSASPAWSNTMRLIPTSPLVKVLRDYAPPESVPTQLRLEGAAGETASAQVIVIPGDAADAVAARMSGLRAANKAYISPSTARLQWVRYMDLAANSTDVPADELVAKAPASIPDPFWEGAERAITPGAAQPLWIEFDIPSTATAGEYVGELSVAGKSAAATIPVTLKVRSFQLSAEPHQRVIQWWDVPGRTFESLKPGTDAYWAHLAGMCDFVRRYRQTDVRISWSLVQPKSGSGDKTVWDTSLVEKYVDTVFSRGIRAVQFDAVAKHNKLQLKQDAITEPVAENMGKLAAVEKLIARRKWQGRVLTSVADEPFIWNEKSYKNVLSQVRKVAPHIGVVEAIETDDIGDLDIYVPKLSHLNLWLPRFEELKREGKAIWFYTCCHPQGRYPNRFLDQQLVAARELHWISYLYDLDGYLHWGLNFFSEDADPYSVKGANPWKLPPGDAQVAYPGKDGFLGSLRLSAMRDGLQDYEYLWTLEHRILALKKRLGSNGNWLNPRQRPLELCRRVVQSCYDHTRDPQLLLDTRSQIADEIEALDATPMLYVQTSPTEGSVTPDGPIMINIRGVATPGSKITVNEEHIIPANISPDGCFVAEAFITADAPTVAVKAELNGVTRTCKRAFKVVE